MRITNFIGEQEVRAGVHITFPSNHETVRFKITSVCDATAPEEWHGEVSFAGTVVLKTQSTDSYERAGRLAEAALVARVVQLLAE